MTTARSTTTAMTRTISNVDHILRVPFDPVLRKFQSGPTSAMRSSSPFPATANARRGATAQPGRAIRLTRPADILYRVDQALADNVWRR
jgi:hypothetical protein